MFGGKVSTLFNAYLRDFVNSMDKTPTKNQETLIKRVKVLEDKVKRLEKKD